LVIAKMMPPHRVGAERWQEAIPPEHQRQTEPDSSRLVSDIRMTGPSETANAGIANRSDRKSDKRSVHCHPLWAVQTGKGTVSTWHRVNHRGLRQVNPDASLFVFGAGDSVVGGPHG
jgi:hypothetical protein